MKKWQVTKKPDGKKFIREWNARRKAFYDLAMTLVVQDITDGISAGVDATGSGFPSLEPETVQRKGHGRPLIDKGLLSAMDTYRRENAYKEDRGYVSIRAAYRAEKSTKTGKIGQRDAPRNEVGYKLQIEGVDSKRGRKYFRFFGITKEAQETILQLVDEIIQNALEAM